MPRMPEHVRNALEKHDSLMSLPSLSIRFVDHNPMHLIDHQVAEGREVNLVPSSFADLRQKWGTKYFQRKYGYSNEPIGVSNTELSNYTRVTRGYVYHQKRFWARVEKLFKNRNLLPRDRFVLFKKSLLDHADFRRIVDLFPSDSDPLKIEKSVGELELTEDRYPRVVDVHKAAALIMAYYAFHHCTTLKNLFRNPEDFGKTPGEKLALLRAYSYFTANNPHTAPDMPLTRLARAIGVRKGKFIPPSDEAAFSEDYPLVRSKDKPFLTNSWGLFDDHLPGVFGYTAMAIFNPNQTATKSYGPWPTLAAHTGIPVKGLVILEPSTQAARDAAKRMLVHLRKTGRLKEAFPVYDWRFRRVWPPEK